MQDKLVRRHRGGYCYEHGVLFAGGWTFRLLDDRDDDGPQLQERAPDGWVPLYSLTLEPIHASDVEMANHYTSTHPSSPFIGRVVAVHEDEDNRVRLLGRCLEVTRPDGTTTKTDVEPHELPGLLHERFGIWLDDDAAAALTG